MLEKMKYHEFDAIYEMITNSFPTHEIREYNEQKVLLDDPKFNVYVIRDDATKRIKAFVSIWNIEDFGFVDHFAVSSEIRNEGLGGKILTEIKVHLGCRIFLEVDIPKDEISKRRIEFYKRNGYTLNPYEYQLPPLVEGRKPVTLMIMSSEGELTHEKFNSLVDELLKTAYGK